MTVINSLKSCVIRRGFRRTVCCEVLEFRKNILRLLPTRVGPPVFQRVQNCVVTVHTATASVQWEAHCIFWCANFKTVVNIQRDFSTFLWNITSKSQTDSLANFSLSLRKQKTERKPTLKVAVLRRVSEA
jgi:hypothetical protein